MRLGRTKFAVCLLCFSLACTVPQLLAEKDKAASSPNDNSNSNSNNDNMTSGARCMP